MRRALVASLVATATLMTAQAASAAPAASLSSSAGPPGTTVTVTGSGFAPNARLDVYVDTTNVAIAAANASGASSTSVAVPASAQPGAHWITLSDAGAHVAAQAQYFVRTDWTQSGFGAQGRRSNDYENSLSPENVGALKIAWAAPAGGFSAPSPFIEYAGYLYVGDTNGTIRAYRPSGSLLWTAAVISSVSSTPAEYGGRVFFAGNDGVVYAYSYACRTDGGTCTPAWTASVGASADLTVYNGKLYVPSSDGSIRVLNPATGAAYAPLTPGSSTPPASSTRVTFTPEGSAYWGLGHNLAENYPSGQQYWDAFSASVSPVSYSNGSGYYTTADGTLRTVTYGDGGGASWTASVGSSGCAVAPAIANGVVFAGGCDHIGAYDAGTGAVRWSVSTTGAPALVVANGVVYACIAAGFYDGTLAAFDAGDGARLWTGGHCLGAPLVANGVLYAAWENLYAYDLTSARAARHGAAHARRPDPRSLRPDPRLRRHHRRG